ncbi:MAG: YqiA/YcfP family alpha/beta fold hydrolase [Candidatus Melainabacteria bacterium]|nr:YqiA/YcfP family alpha/beta fold hydrolase [Candidatus Melainabacteria bacterium]
MSQFDFIYLHGFASSPKSKKAKFFDEHLRECGITACVPDLNTPSFRELTLTNQIDLVGSLLNEHKNQIAIGSSMGGLVATLSALRFPSIKALILLAPGFGIEKRWMQLVDADKRNVWKEDGAIDVFHYASERNESLGYSFVEDLETYSTRNIQVTIPTLILHGINDDVVPVSESHHFAKQNSEFAKLIELNDGHELATSLPEIWQASKEFLEQHSFISRRSI